MNADLLKSVLGCTELPTLPKVAMQILELARCPDVDIRDLASLISNDPALSGRILKTVNSSFYGLSKKVSTISQALVVLGLQSVKTLALGFSLIGTLGRAKPDGFDHMTYWRRSIYSAVAARTLSEHLKLLQTEEIFLAALMQDIGTLALHSALGEQYERIFAQAADHDKLPDLETAELDLNHAQVGRAMAESWSLPPLLSEPIGLHHDPDAASDKPLRVISQTTYLSRLYAEVFMQPQAASAITDARAAGERLFGLTANRADDLLNRVGQSVREAADLFDINIGRQVDYQSILAQARNAMMEMTLQSQQLAVKLESQNRQLAEAAVTDPLTALANRRKITEFLDQEFARAKKFLRPVSVLFADLDHFKQVNDTHGHAAGDAVLKGVGGILRQACRASDCAGRHGGEEFVCVLSETDLLGAAQMAESIRLAVADETFAGGGQTIPVTISIGVAAMERGQFFRDGEHLLAAADRALYAAKRSGRNCVRIFNAAAAVKA